MTKIYISTGEISGDLHASKLVSEIKKIDPSIEFLGTGHTKLAQEGVIITSDLTSVSTVGLIEPIFYLPKIIYTLNKVKRILKQQKPDILILVDYQGYHMLLAKYAKKIGIPVAYYISPQEWLWGTEKGGQKVVKYTDLIFAIFSEEVPFYQKFGANVTFVGHPITQIVKPSMSKKEFYIFNKISLQKKILSIFPGSRLQEIKNILPHTLKAGKNLQEQNPNLEIFISIATSNLEAPIKRIAQKLQIKPHYWTGNSYDLMQATHLAITTSGTITLELAVLGIPFIANFRFGTISAWILKKFFWTKIMNRIKYFALPNMIEKKLIVPELLQDDCNYKNIQKISNEILKDTDKYNKIKKDLISLSQKLHQKHGIKTAAQKIVSYLSL